MLYMMRNKPFATMKGRGPGELALLERLRDRLRSQPSEGGISLGMGDDCALLRAKPGEEMAITTDLSIGGRHFRLAWHPPESVGHRTIARGLSDLAAMGARPVAAFLSLGLPGALTQSAGHSKSWLDRFLDGFLSLAISNNAPLAGGDLSESPIALADIILVGAVPHRGALLRSGAAPGDRLYVTGTLGGSAASLVLLRKLARTERNAARLGLLLRKHNNSLAPHLYPKPRIAQGVWLRRKGLATAAIDLSDGLSTDLAHLCKESHVAAEIDAGSIPIHHAASLDQALHGGEDYELLFTAPASTRVPRALFGVPITAVGRVLQPRAGKPEITLLKHASSEALTSRGWQHFV